MKVIEVEKSFLIVVPETTDQMLRALYFGHYVEGIITSYFKMNSLERFFHHLNKQDRFAVDSAVKLAVKSFSQGEESFAKDFQALINSIYGALLGGFVEKQSFRVFAQGVINKISEDYTSNGKPEEIRRDILLKGVLSQIGKKG
jgi:hypothetical protein